VEQIIAKGHYISVNTAMINSQRGRKVIKNVPVDRVLTETDGPYVGFKGRPVLPSDLANVLVRLGMIWKLSYEETERQININFLRLISVLK